MAENGTCTSKRNKYCAEKTFDSDPPKRFPESSATALLFAATRSGSSCEITDVHTGIVLTPCRVPSLGSTPGEREGPGQASAKPQQQLAGEAVRKRTAAAHSEEEGSGARRSCYDPTSTSNRQVLLSCPNVHVLPIALL